MRVTRYVRKTTLDALRARAGGAFLGGPINSDATAPGVDVPIVLALPDPPIEVTGYWCDKKKQEDMPCGHTDGCRRKAIGTICTKYTGPLNPVTP